MDSKSLKLKFCGGVGSVTGANFLLYSDSTKVLVDCGLQQGVKQHCENDPNRKPFPFDPAEIDFLLVTHAHADHIGRIPKLVKDGFRGQIISTPTTLEIVKLMFDDALNILDQEAKRCRIEPIYTKQDVKHALALWKTTPYHEKAVLNDEFDY
jgi:metallo-beta-lactamase family protein